jgi:hypothetical protein
MCDTCTIYFDLEGTGDDDLDPDTGQLDPPVDDSNAIYSGRCLIVPTGIGTQEGAEGAPTRVPGLRTVKAYIPKNAPEVPVHSVLVVSHSVRDPYLAGRPMRVLGVEYSSFAVARTLQIEEVR